MARRTASFANVMRAEMWNGAPGNRRRATYQKHHKRVCRGCGRKPSRHYTLELHHIEYLPATLTGHEADSQLAYLCVRVYGWLGRLLHDLHLMSKARGCHRLVHRLHKWRWPKDAARPDQADYKKLRTATPSSSISRSRSRSTTRR